jgi:hypothetical protein
LVDIGVLEEDDSSEWASPSFAIPKKNGIIRVFTDLGITAFNLLLKYRIFTHFPIPKTEHSNMNRSMEGFTFTSALDLNMGYYHIKLETDAKNLRSIVFPWYMGKYKYKRLPMGIKIVWSLMFFSKRHVKACQRYEYFKIYLDYLLALQIEASNTI